MHIFSASSNQRSDHIQRRYHSTLERRLATYVGLGTLLFSLLVGGLAYLYFSRRGVNHAWALERQLAQTVTSQAAVGVFAQNHLIAQEVIDGLLLNPLILGVRLESTEGFQVTQTKSDVLDFFTAASHPLPSPINATEFIGNLYVILDLVAVQHAATTEAMNYAGLMVLQIMVAALILMMLFRRLLGQPVADLAQRMIDISPGTGMRLIIDEHHVHDEIGLLSRSANVLLDAADRALHEERDIRQRLTEVNDSLRVERDFIRNLIDTLPGIFYLFDQNGKFRLWNRRFEELTGLTAEAVARSVPTDYFYGDDQKLIVDRIQEAFVHGHTSIEADFMVKDNLTIPFYFEGSRIDLHGQPHLIGLGVDISDRRRAERALRIQEEQYRLISENMIDLICLLTPNSTFLYVSPSVETMLGYHPQYLLGRRVTEFIHTEDLEKYGTMTAPETISAGQRPPMVYRLRTKHGNYIWVESLIKPIFDKSGIMVRWQSVSRDVTEREHITIELRQARQTAEKASQVKGEFLATMSHEIRTPMNAIIGLTDLALRQEPPAKLESYLAKIRYASRSLLRIINDILDFSKIEAGKLILESVTFNLHDLFDNLGNMFRSTAADKALELNLVIDNATPCYLVGDPTRLEQILINLISNAIKFTERGEVMVHIAPLEITEQHVHLKIIVRDSGIGMTTAQIANLFNPFSQADSSITRQYGGTGLGLSICKRLVEMMHGEIWVASTPNQGSAFYFTTTCAITAAKDLPCAATIILPTDLQGLNIMVVDDNESAQLVLQESLHGLQCAPTIVNSGKAALLQMHAALTSNIPFDLILIDQRMPEMDGIETIRQLLHIAAAAKPLPKIIMLTAFSDQDLLLAAKNVGIDSLLQKPIDHHTLFNAILEVFNRDNMVRSSAQWDDPTTRQEISRKLGGAKILLVEDNAINREVAREILTHVGISIDEAHDGQAALRMIHLVNYDAVLMDIQMPIMDGITATRLIRREPKFQALPIIAMTAHAMMDIHNESLLAGMNDYVIKPIEQDQLFATLLRWVTPHYKFVDTSPNLTSDTPLDPEKIFLPPAVNGIDLAAALARVNHNQQVMRSILAEFTHNYAHAARQLRELLDSGRKDEGRNLAHAIKGVAGNLSANDLFNAAFALETAINEERRQKWPILLNNFEDQLTVVLRAIVAIPWQETPNTKKQSAADIINREAAITLLQQLITLLADDDGAAHTVFAAIKPILLEHNEHDAVAQIAASIDCFDYKNALAILQQLSPHLFG